MSEKSSKKITFLFGAGAEQGYKLPSGPQYTLDTILSKRELMYTALEEFYKDRVSEKYVKEYRKEFMFQKNSNSFYEIVIRALEKCLELEKSRKKIDTDTKEILSEYKKIKKMGKESEVQKICKEKLKPSIEKIYDYVIIDLDEEKKTKECRSKNIEKTDKYYSLMNVFSYYGSIEKDFSAIINPEECGSYRFWRLMNYFWSAYFSILLPIVEQGNLIPVGVGNKYKYVLDNLQEITKTIYSDEFFEKLKSKKKNKADYYQVFLEKYKDSQVITTNYTPFIKSYWGEQSAYLAGSIELFEIPDKLLVTEAENITDKDFCFPYMATQAPVKPIVEGKQLREYAKAIKYLEETDCLVIIGYGINDNDNHINALLREYLVKDKKHELCYFHYQKEGTRDEKAVRDNLKSKLKLENEIRESQLKVVFHEGKPEDCLKKFIDL